MTEIVTLYWAHQVFRAVSPLLFEIIVKNHFNPSAQGVYLHIIALLYSQTTGDPLRRLAQGFTSKTMLHMSYTKLSGLPRTTQSPIVCRCCSTHREFLDIRACMRIRAKC